MTWITTVAKPAMDERRNSAPSGGHCVSLRRDSALTEHHKATPDKACTEKEVNSLLATNMFLPENMVIMIIQVDGGRRGERRHLRR